MDFKLIGLFVTGLISGIISGMGIGGGTILIPALDLFFDMPQKVIQSINLIYFIPTAGAALTSHIKNKRVELKPLKAIIPLGILGALIGSVVALGLDNTTLRSFCGWFLLIMGIREITIGIKSKIF
jgi:hypothetical protein